jgi:hypothetical protein
MSFTLVRYKDGREIPIKVSILDAFRRAPPRRPKPVQPEKKVWPWSTLSPRNFILPRFQGLHPSFTP